MTAYGEPDQVGTPTGQGGNPSKQLDGVDVDGATLEGHLTISRSKDGVIFTQANTATRLELGTALTDDDVAGDDRFATELLNTTALRNRIATVVG